MRSRMHTQGTVTAPAHAQHALQVAYDTLLSMGKTEGPPLLDTTFLFASVCLVLSFEAQKFNRL